MVFQRHIFSNPFYFFFSSSQEAINATIIFLEGLKKLPPGGNDINILVATHELESFAVKYGKTHLTANESAVIVQKLFGEFYALFDESGFFNFYFQLTIYKFTSRFIFKITLIYARC